MSRRQRQRRGDKRSRYDFDVSPALAEALEQIGSVELPKQDEADPDVIVMKDGWRIDTRAPWPFPSGPHDQT